MQLLESEHENEKLFASWSHLVDLLKSEQHDLVKLPALTQVSIYPKPITERQKVSTCLKIKNK